MIILSDFDGTITSNDSISTIGLYNRIYPEYMKELRIIRNELINSKLNSEIITLKYAKIQLELLSKYLKENDNVDESLYDFFKLRGGFENLINYVNRFHHELIICSSGIGNVINKVIEKNDIDNTNIKIISNFYNLNNEFDLNNIIYSKVKYNDYILKRIESDFILIGNHPSDINMLPTYKKPVTSFGFSDKKLDCFDYTFDDSSSFDNVLRLIKMV